MEVKVGNEWSGNSAYYATEAESKAAGKELLSRWWVPTDRRAVPSEHEVNYYFDFALNRSTPVTELVPDPVPTQVPATIALAA